MDTISTGQLMNVKTATVTLESMAPYSQSKKHYEPVNKGELAADYDIRTWRKKQFVGPNGKVHIDAAAFHQALVAAAKYTKQQIPGQGKATWTAKFSSGIALFDSIDLGVDPEKTDFIDIYANADGIRGSGKRVQRRFPVINEWKATFTIHILDPIITQEVFAEMVRIAGMFIGVGRFRPEKGGRNGRFKMTKLVWE
jgi:hypothetical protein